jgi:hypothetical protein
MSPQGEGSGSFAWRRLEHALPAPAAYALPAAAILQAGLSVSLTRHEVVDSDLTREQPPSARTAKVASTATSR